MNKLNLAIVINLVNPDKSCKSCLTRLPFLLSRRPLL